MKGSVLELGGKDPQIVCADADLANAISGCVWGGFANAGQTCSGIERTYVVRDVADEFLRGRRPRDRATSPSATRLRWDTEIGPMVSADQFEIVTEPGRRRARRPAPSGSPAARARSTASTASSSLRRCSAGVTDEMRIMREEIFGPVVPIIVVDNEEEAIERANDSNFGLGASIWTKDRAKGERMARRIESGMVWINDHSYTHAACQCSWGGVKDSGLGRSHSKFGLYECVEVKLVAWEPGLTRDLWWQPYDEHARQGAPGLGPAALRPQRPARQGAQGRRDRARQGRRAHLPQGRVAPGTSARSPGGDQPLLLVLARLALLRAGRELVVVHRPRR